jgi:hypothetical protein
VTIIVLSFQFSGNEDLMREAGGKWRSMAKHEQDAYATKNAVTETKEIVKEAKKGKSAK